MHWTRPQSGSPGFADRVIRRRRRRVAGGVRSLLLLRGGWSARSSEPAADCGNDVGRRVLLNVVTRVFNLHHVGRGEVAPPPLPDILAAAEGEIPEAPYEQQWLAGQPLRCLRRQISQPWPRPPDLAGKDS